jgi:dihydroorotase (multifunctional complex type)
MAIELRIAGGDVMTPAGRRPADLLIDDGKIVGLVNADVDISDIGRTVDAGGKLVVPGMVDPHVHTREPGFTHKEDITTSTQAAAAGGVTTVFGMPNLKPPTSSIELLDEVLELYKAKSVVDYNHNPAATDPTQIAGMAERGIAAFKVFMVVDTGRTYPHPAGTGMHNHGDLLRMMDTIVPTGLPFMIHPHDQALMDYIEGEYLARGENTPQAYAQAYAARDGVIWDSAVDTLLRLGEASGCPIHLMHMQTRRSIDAVRRAKARGVAVTCEINHWAPFLSRWEDVERLGPYALSYWVPDDHREAVWEGLLDGTIDMLSSDHAPHTREEKEVGWEKMWSAHTGTPGVQYQLPLLLEAALDGKLTLERAIEVTASRPAGVFGLADKGVIAPGTDADLVVIDLDQPWTISNDTDLSRCGWTPYDGRKCRVRVERTFLRGSEIYADGTVTGVPGQGRMVVPANAPTAVTAGA